MCRTQNQPQQVEPLFPRPSATGDAATAAAAAAGSDAPVELSDAHVVCCVRACELLAAVCTRWVHHPAAAVAAAGGMPSGRAGAEAAGGGGGAAGGRGAGGGGGGSLHGALVEGLAAACRGLRVSEVGSLGAGGLTRKSAKGRKRDWRLIPRAHGFECQSVNDVHALYLVVYYTALWHTCKTGIAHSCSLPPKTEAAVKRLTPRRSCIYSVLLLPYCFPTGYLAAACGVLRAVADTLPPLLPLEPAPAGGGIEPQQQAQQHGLQTVGRRALTSQLVSLTVDWLLQAVSRWARCRLATRRKLTCFPSPTIAVCPHPSSYDHTVAH